MDKRIKKLLAERDRAWRFPGDVYGTFSALGTIAAYDKKMLEGEPLGRILALLVSVESRPGGPYYSHFPGAKEKGGKKVIDRKTNEAIRQFLYMYGVNLPNLEKFLHIKESKRKRKKSDTPAFLSSELPVMRSIRILLSERLAPLHPDFRKRAIYAVERTIHGNPDKQMSLMPYYMKRALGKRGSRISEKTVASMGLANIFFWTAFIIYDDFWDEDEAADPHLLPVANLFARSYLEFFGSVFRGNKGNLFLRTLMDELDGANAWETTRCRAMVKDDIFQIPDTLPSYGNYTKKYLPASGHILGPLALLMESGYKIDSKEARYLIDYFKHYLIAMQINDDMHDWEEDLRRGHISTVVDMLLRDLGPGRKTVDLKKDMRALRKTFWFTTLPKMARKAKIHLKKSRSALAAMKSVENPAPLLYFINYNESIADKALNEQKQSIQFLGAYEKASS